MIDLKSELRAQAQPQNYVADLAARAAKRIEELEACLHDTRDEICEGPVDDVLWHSAVPACTTVDNITLVLNDGWTYDGWLEAKETQE